MPRKKKSEVREVTREYDVTQLNVQAHGRFRSDIGVLYQKARLLMWMERAKAQDLKLDEMVGLAREIKALSKSIEDQIGLAKAG